MAPIPIKTLGLKTRTVGAGRHRVDWETRRTIVRVHLAGCMLSLGICVGYAEDQYVLECAVPWLGKEVCALCILCLAVRSRIRVFQEIHDAHAASRHLSSAQQNTQTNRQRALGKVQQNVAARMSVSHTTILQVLEQRDSRVPALLQP